MHYFQNNGPVKMDPKKKKVKNYDTYDTYDADGVRAFRPHLRGLTPPYKIMGAGLRPTPKIKGLVMGLYPDGSRGLYPDGLVWGLHPGFS